MSCELKEGLKLKLVSGFSAYANEALFLKLGERERDCSEITVTMETGQMARVPWAKAVKNNGEVVLVNLANVESVVPL